METASSPLSEGSPAASVYRSAESSAAQRPPGSIPAIAEGYAQSTSQPSPASGSTAVQSKASRWCSAWSTDRAAEAACGISSTASIAATSARSSAASAASAASAGAASAPSPGGGASSVARSGTTSSWVEATSTSNWSSTGRSANSSSSAPAQRCPVAVARSASWSRCAVRGVTSDGQ